MVRETVSKEQIRILNMLSWDKKLYANFKFANGDWGLEVNYYLGNAGYHYKVVCDDEEDMHKLRAELDANTKLVELHDGRKVSCGR